MSRQKKDSDGASSIRLDSLDDYKRNYVQNQVAIMTAKSLFGTDFLDRLARKKNQADNMVVEKPVGNLLYFARPDDEWETSCRSFCAFCGDHQERRPIHHTNTSDWPPFFFSR